MLKGWIERRRGFFGINFATFSVPSKSKTLSAYTFQYHDDDANYVELPNCPPHKQSPEGRVFCPDALSQVCWEALLLPGGGDHDPDDDDDNYDEDYDHNDDLYTLCKKTPVLTHNGLPKYTHTL